MERQGKSAGPARSARPELKICGVTTAVDAAHCLALGVDWVGFNLCARSRRYVAADAAHALWRDALAAASEPCGRTRVAVVVVDATDGELQALLGEFPAIAALQFHGAETPERLASWRRRLAAGTPREIWKAVAVGTPADVAAAQAFATVCDLVLYDTAAAAPGAAVHGGSGQAFDWTWLAAADAPDAGGAHQPFGIAGGIRPGMIAAAAALGPRLIDVCSGSEAAIGRKDPAKVTALWGEIGRVGEGSR